MLLQTTQFDRAAAGAEGLPIVVDLGPWWRHSQSGGPPTLGRNAGRRRRWSPRLLKASAMSERAVATGPSSRHRSAWASCPVSSTRWPSRRRIHPPRRHRSGRGLRTVGASNAAGHHGVPARLRARFHEPSAPDRRCGCPGGLVLGGTMAVMEAGSSPGSAPAGPTAPQMASACWSITGGQGAPRHGGLGRLQAGPCDQWWSTTSGSPCPARSGTRAARPWPRPSSSESNDFHTPLTSGRGTESGSRRAHRRQLPARALSFRRTHVRHSVPGVRQRRAPGPAQATQIDDVGRQGRGRR